MTAPEGPGDAPMGGAPVAPSFPPLGPMSYAPGPPPPPPPPPPGPMGYEPPPPPTRGRRTGLIIVGVIALIVVLIVGAIVFFGNGRTGVTALKVGDCFDEPATSGTITDVQHQPCTSPHDGEVFAVLTHPAASGEPYPVVSGFDDYIEQNCIPAWEAYTARTFATDTELTLSYYHPTVTGWGDGDRGFSCYTTRADDIKLNGSVRGIGSSALP